jgi:hypothetical protein
MKARLVIALLLIPAPAVLPPVQNSIAGVIKPELGAEAESEVCIPSSLTRQHIVEKAKSWVGKSFKPGQTARCADFVRSVLDGVGVKPGISSQPIDKETPSPETANSFFGPDLGKVKKSKEELLPGDLVAFGGTYGGYSPGTITHVGIYIGDGRMVDRPTANEPVKERSIDTFQHFVAGVELKNVN